MSQEWAWQHCTERERERWGGREKRWPTGEEVWTGAGPLKEEPADGERHSQFSYRKRGWEGKREWGLTDWNSRKKSRRKDSNAGRWTDRKMGWTWSKRLTSCISCVFQLVQLQDEGRGLTQEKWEQTIWFASTQGLIKCVNTLWGEREHRGICYSKQLRCLLETAQKLFIATPWRTHQLLVDLLDRSAWVLPCLSVTHIHKHTHAWA